MSLRVILALIVGLAAGVAGSERIRQGLDVLMPGTFSNSPPGTQTSPGDEGDGKGERKPLYWVAPMDASYRRDEPGLSPMGMELIPVYAEDGDADEDAVRINPAVVNNIGVRTEPVEVGAVKPPIHTIGRIEYDERHVVQIHPRTPGWIEKLVVHATGDPVKKGDLLFEIFSPELVNAQTEFLTSLARGRKTLIEASRDRLRALGISEGQIRELEQSGVPAHYIKFFSPIDGVITALSVVEGDYVRPDSDVMALADLATVWLISDVFESDADLLETGSVVIARSNFDPGLVFIGRLNYIYPSLDARTQTIQVRTVLDNADGKFKPGMYMSVEIEGNTRGEAMLVPREAVIMTGLQERVIVALGDGRFRPVLVETGREAGDKIEILSGITPDQSVVVSGQFLIDSESSVTSASLRLTPPDPVD